MDYQIIMQILQAVSVILAMTVAAGTIRGRSNDKIAVLTKMQVDIEYIKQRIDGFDEHSGKLVELDGCCKQLHKRMDDHLQFDHVNKEGSGKCD
jgi:hypothetical protein